MYIAGTWDLFHAGHISLLEQARALGDYVIVGIYNDSLANTVYRKSRIDETKRNLKIADHTVEQRNGNVSSSTATNISKYSNNMKIISNNLEGKGESKALEGNIDSLAEYYPIFSMQERMLSVLGCKYVSDVLIDAPYNLTYDMISCLNISVVLSDQIDHDCDDQNSSSSSGRNDSSRVNSTATSDIDIENRDIDTRLVAHEEESSSEDQDPYRIVKELNIFQTIKPTFNITG